MSNENFKWYHYPFPAIMFALFVPFFGWYILWKSKTNPYLKWGLLIFIGYAFAAHIYEIATTDKPKQKENTTVGAAVSIKFGLTEAQRKEAFKDLILAERNALNTAQQKYGTNQLPELTAYKNQLETENRNAVAKKYNLSLDQLQEIGVEGQASNWEFPQ